MGYARERVKCTASDPYIARAIISSPIRIPESEVKTQIMEYGPVVLEVNGDTLKKYNSRGIVTDLTPAPPNHAVTVIGWEGGNWIIRNSLGNKRVPHEIPSDLSCVKRGSNDCSVDWVHWSGMSSDPGYVMLPQSFESLHVTKPSPWIVAAVSVK